MYTKNDVRNVRPKESNHDGERRIARIPYTVCSLVRVSVEKCCRYRNETACDKPTVSHRCVRFTFNTTSFYRERYGTHG